MQSLWDVFWQEYITNYQGNASQTCVGEAESHSLILGTIASR